MVLRLKDQMEEHIRYEATATTPYFDFDFEKGLMTLTGVSVSSDPIQFYQPIHELLDEYVKEPAAITVIDIKLDYFNSTSAKCLLDLFKKAEKLGNTATIIWRYEKDDEDLKEAGKEYSEIVKVPFRLVEF